MAEHSNHSSELRSQLWQAERLRTVLALGLLGAVAITSFLREIIAPTKNASWFVVTLTFILSLAALELLWFALLNRTRRGTGECPILLLALSTLFEVNIPTIGIALLSYNPAMGPYRALVAPVVLIYFPFIILTAFRMRPWLCILAGLAASTGYVSIVTATCVSCEPTVIAMPTTSYVTAGVILVIAGLLTAVVSQQILQNMSRAIESTLAQRKLQADMAIARTIQQGLLPTEPPQVAGFDIAGQSRPADETGGDHFDWLPLTDGRTVVTLADVTGHGIGPALLAANLHAYVHALFSRKGELVEWVTHLNYHLAHDLTEGRFVTFAAVAIDPASETISVLSAGQGPLLLYRAGEDRVVQLETQAPPLGVRASFVCEAPHVLRLASGDFLALITDGYFEWANGRGERYGLERLEASLRRHRSLDATSIIGGIGRDVAAFAGGTSQADDLTAVVIKRI